MAIFGTYLTPIKHDEDSTFKLYDPVEDRYIDATWDPYIRMYECIINEPVYPLDDDGELIEGDEPTYETSEQLMSDTDLWRCEVKRIVDSV